MRKIRSFAKRNALLVFFGIAFAIAVPAFVLQTPQTPAVFVLLLLMLGSYGPAVAALAILDLNQDGVGSQALRKRIWKWRVGAKWYLLTLLLPTVIWLVASAITLALDAMRAFQLSQLAFLPVIFVTNFGEEIGWRGFVLPRLVARLRPVPASLLLGLIWGLFHLPLYWQRPVYAILNFPLTLGLSMVLTWLFLNTGGSVPLCTLFHAVFNTWAQVFLNTPGSEIMLVSAILVLWVFAGLLVLRFGLGLVRMPQALSGGYGGTI